MTRERWNCWNHLHDDSIEAPSGVECKHLRVISVNGFFEVKGAVVFTNEGGTTRAMLSSLFRDECIVFFAFRTN